MKFSRPKTGILAFLLAIVSTQAAAWAQHDPWSFILPEQRRVEVRSPSQLPPASIPMIPRPPTITDNQFDYPVQTLSLSDAINTGLSNLDVVRVLAGVTAVSSGRTVYDVAIANTRIDQQRGAFDPNLRINNVWNRNESPTAIFDPLDPTQSLILGGQSDNHNLNMGLSKRTLTGGIIDFGVNSADSRTGPGVFPLNPQNRNALDLSYTQPLLRGAGATVNRIPIVLSRIDAERSFFQYKDSVQSHVQGVIEAYWALVFARTDLWAREQQVEQLRFANELAQARLDVGDANLGDVAQTQVAYEGFRAILISSQANVLQREAALRNILGLPPYEPVRVVPVSPLIDERLDIDWPNIVGLAETQRPDIIELKLVLEADQQRLILSRNQATPQLDGVALYRWNGLEGEMPNGNFNSSRPGEFADWNFGVNFSVPLGLRSDRAVLRQQELVIRRDQANLQQGLHQAIHILALNLRNLDQFYEQYRRYQAVRAAAKINLNQQTERFNFGSIQFIVVLQAIVDWGNAISNEAQALVQYNTELASLERETGTILEAHGIAFYEERYGSIGPLGRLAENQPYPLSTRPNLPGADRYGAGDKPSEELFDLRNPMERMEDTSDEPDAGLIEEVPPPATENEAELERKDLKDDATGLKQKLRDAPVRAAEAIRGLFK